MRVQLSKREEQREEGPFVQTWAAVSFLLEDAAWCDWLYREFDGERIPRQLISRPTRFGNIYPERISVAPDPTDPSQLDSFEETLLSSHHLILIVSPASAKSSLIDEHRRRFKENGGEERVIALIVKGVPASPATEPGCESDEAWLPEWLSWRFENNAFQPASRSEPLVIDARMGLASLAEVRARLMAALLDINQEEFAELGFVTRPTTTLLEVSQDLMRDFAPGSSQLLKIAESIPEAPKHSNFAIWICGLVALAALLILICTPDNLLTFALSRRAKPATAEHEQKDDEPLVEVRPMLNAPFPPERSPNAPGKEKTAATQLPAR